MTFDSVLNSVLKNDFEEAVSLWREYSYDKYFSANDAVQKWNTCARTLEARLVYLLLLGPDAALSDALENYRFWLIKQKSTIVEWTEIGEAPLKLPKNMYIGNKDIDADHKKLFDMANNIRNKLRAGEMEIAAGLASELLDETIDHFKREEEILHKYGYPDANKHAHYHDHLLLKMDNLRNMINKLAKGGQESVVAFDALIIFLIDDPIVADMEFKPFFSDIKC